MFSITKNMKKIYSVICGKYRKFEKSKISYLVGKKLVLSIICSNWMNENEKLFKKNCLVTLKYGC